LNSLPISRARWGHVALLDSAQSFDNRVCLRKHFSISRSKYLIFQAESSHRQLSNAPLLASVLRDGAT